MYSARCRSRIFSGVTSVATIADPFLLGSRRRVEHPSPSRAGLSLPASGFHRLHRYYGLLRLLAGPPPRSGNLGGAVAAAIRTIRVLPRSAFSLRDVPSLLPRGWASVRTSSTFPTRAAFADN